MARGKITGGADLQIKVDIYYDLLRKLNSTSLASVSVQTTEVTRVATLTVSALGLV